MRQMICYGAGALIALVLVSCGGHVSDSTATIPTGGGSAVTITLDTGDAAVSSLQGFGLFFTIGADIVGAPVDNTGYSLTYLDPDHLTQAVSFSDTTGVVQLEISTLSSLSTGVHKGTLTLEACDDAVKACGRIVGSTKLTLQVTVQPRTNLTTLTPLAGVSDWQSAQGGNAHANYVPVTLDPTKFNSRWIKLPLDTRAVADSGPGQTSEPVTDAANQVIVVQTQTGIVALAEGDGKELWHLTSPVLNSPIDPSIYNGVVYVSLYTASGGTLESLAEADGSSLNSTLLAGCGVIDECEPGSPVVVGTRVFVTPGSTTLPVYAFDTTTLAASWVPTAGGGGFGSPAADAADVYFYTPNATTPGAVGTAGFTAIDQATGGLQWSVVRAADPAKTFPSILLGGTPALDASGGAVVNLDALDEAGGPIERYDLTTHQRLWQVGLDDALNFAGLPGTLAVGNGSVYIGTQTGGVMVLDLATGATQWTWDPPLPGDIRYLLVTKNLLFVASVANDVVAIDLKTHAIVWRYPISAFSLSISPNGILYVSGQGIGQGFSSGGVLGAVNLQ